MPVSRMELADVGSPDKIVSLILRFEPDMPIPTPVEELAQKLDIAEICPLNAAGFEGGLVTDPERSMGVILVQEGALPARRRFTIAHELGHFLIASHIPDQPGRFLCSRADMLRLTAKEVDRRARMEVEANRFASLLLIPPPALRQAMRAMSDPDIDHVMSLARQFGVSKEAMARAYAEYHEAAVAIVVAHNKRVLRTYRNSRSFPWLQVGRGADVPFGSLLHRNGHAQNVPSEFVECAPSLWIDVERGKAAPTLYEQVYVQQEGFALVLLHLIAPDEEELQEDDDLQRSWTPRFGR